MPLRLVAVVNTYCPRDLPTSLLLRTWSVPWSYVFTTCGAFMVFALCIVYGAFAAPVIREKRQLFFRRAV